MKNFKLLSLMSLILLVTAVAFIPCLNNGYVVNWDDSHYLLDNGLIKNLTFANLKGIFTYSTLGLYSPLVLLSYSVEYPFFKLDPYGYHLTNLILHLCNSLLVFWIVFLLCDKKKLSIAFIAALLFGIHPMRVESVAWISERKDMLYSFFFLGASGFYLRYLRNQKEKLYYLCLLSFTLSLLSKPTGILFPLLMMLFDYFSGKPYLSRKFLMQKVPFFIIAIIFMLCVVTTGVKKILSEPPVYFLHNILVASYAIVFYLYKLFVPVRLSCFYPYPQENQNQLAGIFLFSLAILLILIAGVVICRRYTKKIVFASLFFLITIFPSLQFIPYLPSVAADRNTYIPYIGLFYIIGNIISWVYARLKNRVVKSIFCLFLIFMLIVLSLLTWQRCKVWNNGQTIWQDALDKYPDSASVNNNLAVEYSDQGQPDKAIFYYRKVLELDPYYAEAYNNIGVALLNKKEYDKAMPEFIKALRIDPTLADAYFNIAAIYGMRGNHKKVIELCRKAIKFNPQHSNAYAYLCSAYGNLGNFTEAIVCGEKAVAINPRLALAHSNLSVAYYYAKQYDLAVKHCNEAIKLGNQVDPRFRLLQPYRK